MTTYDTLIREIVDRSVQERGYVVLRFRPCHTYKPGEVVRAFVDGPFVRIQDRTDHRDWSQQVRLVRAMAGRPTAKSCRRVQYYRAVPVNGGAA